MFVILTTISFLSTLRRVQTTILVLTKNECSLLAWLRERGETTCKFVQIIVLSDTFLLSQIHISLGRFNFQIPLILN